MGRRYSEDVVSKRLASTGVVDALGRRHSENCDLTRNSRRTDGGLVYDPAWEQARRLSEAGVRKVSDAGVVLTEDTDSFVIGDRIWVGGTKHGVIAYIGETQFAPGEWAGVVLDEPVGKNDGSVAGIRYFQCEQKRGVFSRLTRLSRTPLEGFPDISESGSDYYRPNGTSSSMPGSPPRRSSLKQNTPSPSTSMRDLKKSPSPSPSPIGINLHQVGDLKVGERVIVNSQQGTKSGILRYLGTTDFAVGDWAGVELDEPIGKNDGSVAGKRYFDCKPRYGLFAPTHKVLRATPAVIRKASATARQAATGAIRRHGSRESLSSVSSVASSVRAPRRPSRTSTSNISAAQNALQADADEDGFY